MDMTKFENADDPGFKAIIGEIRRWVKALAVPSDAAAPEAEPSGPAGQVRQKHTMQGT
jgi:hypothetical protein